MPPRKPTPTHAELTAFLEKFLPPSPNPETQAREVSFLYHTVRSNQYSPTTQSTSRVVFSITPTRGVYTALEVFNPRYQSPVCFLHRPFNLDRRAVSRGTLVLSSHKSFDEYLTVGWNTALGERLGLQLENAVCIQGYKKDSERKIGLVAKLQRPSLLSEFTKVLRAEFGDSGVLFSSQGSFAAEPDPTARVDGCAHTNPLSMDTERPIDVVAIMNAFHAEEVRRVLTAAHMAGWIENVTDGRQILYLTGAAREHGIKAVAEVGMPTFCVGHIACEEWGIRYLAQQTRNRWPGLDVVEIFEEEQSRSTSSA